MKHVYSRNVIPNEKCSAHGLYKDGCISNEWCDISDQIDLRQFIVSPVMDQGLLNSCSGCALSAAIEITLNRENDHYFDDCSQGSKASAMFIYYHERLLENKELENTPVLISDGFEALQGFGVCCADLWPYPQTHVPDSLWELVKTGTLEEISERMTELMAHKEDLINSLMAQKPSEEATEQALAFRKIVYRKLSIKNGIDEIKHAITNHTPVIFGFIEPRSLFEIPASGIMPIPTEDELRIGGHAVCAVGFDDEKQALLIRNSYGDDFGLDGYFYMPYEFVLGSYLANEQSNPNAFDFYCLLEERG